MLTSTTPILFPLVCEEAAEQGDRQAATGTLAVELLAHARAAKADARIILLSGLVEMLGLTGQITGAGTVIPKSANEVRQPPPGRFLE